MTINKIISSLVLSAGTLMVPVAHAAQELPDRPISLVVGFVAGGAADTSAR